jgi:hypothetical protein
LHIATTAPGTSVFKFFGRSPVALLDLTVTIPAGLPVTLTDTSGDLEVAGVAALDLKDDSGGITVEEIGRDFIVHAHGSGEINFSRVHRQVQIPSRRP